MNEVNQQQDGYTINSSKIWGIIKQQKFVLLKIVGGCTIAALLLASVLPKNYESDVVLRTKERKNGFSMQTAALALLGGAATTQTSVYEELIKTRSVLEPVIKELDWPAEKKEDLTIEEFVKNQIKIESPKKTDLLRITGKGKTPEEAQFIAQRTAESLQVQLTVLSRDEQSGMLKFFDERRKIALKELEENEVKLQAFKSKVRVYVPSEQGKLMLTAFGDIDKRVAEAKISNEINRVQLSEVNAQLNKQNRNMAEFGIADHPVVEELRKNILVKEVNLVSLRQQYTDKHPTVMLAEKEIAELQAKLKEEITKEILSETTIMNPVQKGLLEQKVLLEVASVSGEAVQSALMTRQTVLEKEIDKLSTNELDFVRLSRNAAISQEVYTVLMRQYEQTRIQAAMESMDVQIVDPANLPKKPVAPKKMLITVVGFVLGMFCAFGRIGYCYMKR